MAVAGTFHMAKLLTIADAVLHAGTIAKHGAVTVAVLQALPVAGRVAVAEHGAFTIAVI